MDYHLELPSLENVVSLQELTYRESPTVAESLLSQLSRLHIVLPESINTLTIDISRWELQDMFNMRFKQDWVAVDDALSYPKLGGLMDLDFRSDGELVILNRDRFHHDILIELSDLLPKTYQRGLLGWGVVRSDTVGSARETS